LSQVDGQVKRTDIGHAPEEKANATMADVVIHKRKKEHRLLEQAQGPTTECERGMARPGPVPFFSLTVRDLLTASPSELMRRFTESMARLFEGTSVSPMTVWSPSIAIFEKDEHIKVCAELPGLSEDDVRVELTRDGLTISGERTREQDDRREGIYWPERFCRSFMRTIPIPDEAQVEKATATFENEILTVVVPLPNSEPSQELAGRVRALRWKWRRR
jgi:HSP20 family molecular chaperone IbpA